MILSGQRSVFYFKRRCILEGFILHARLATVLFLEAIGVKEEIPGEIREPQALSDSIGVVVFLACWCQGVLLSSTSTQASLSGELVATVTDLLFFIKLATSLTHNTFFL